MYNYSQNLSNLSVSTFRIDSACPHALDAADLTMDLSNGSIQWIRTPPTRNAPAIINNLLYTNK